MFGFVEADKRVLGVAEGVVEGLSEVGEVGLVGEFVVFESEGFFAVL